MGDPSKMKFFHSKGFFQVVKHCRMWHANGLSDWVCRMKRLAIKADNNLGVNPFKNWSTWSFSSSRSSRPCRANWAQRSTPNAQRPTPNAAETVSLIVELPAKDFLNLIWRHPFLVEKMNNNFLVVIHRWLKFQTYGRYKRLRSSSLSIEQVKFDMAK
jgi:hypothetical protein